MKTSKRNPLPSEATASFSGGRVGRLIERPSALAVLIAALAMAIFAIDVRFERGVAGGVPYVLVVALSAGLPGAVSTLGFAAAGSALTVFGYLWSPAGAEAWIAITNRLLAVFAIWVTAILLINRKRLAARLAQAARYVERIVEASPSAMLLVDQDGRIVLANAEAERLSGYTRHELLGQPVDVLVPTRYRDRHPEQRAAFTATAKPRRLGSGLQLSMRRKDGRERPAEIGLAPFPTEHGTCVLTVIADMTERVRHEETLRAKMLARQMEAAQEAERRQLAREVHDALGQSLTALKLDIAWLERHLPGDAAELRARARATAELAGTTLDKVRDIASKLRPPILDDCGLVEAVRWQLDEFEQRTGIAFAITAPTDEAAWGDEQSTAIFRILQEALTNVARHAGATSVAVVLRVEDGTAVLEVRDNGRGITPQQAARHDALGMHGMRERAELHGGRLTVSGAQGSGTTVEVRMPLGRVIDGAASAANTPAEM